MTKSTDQTDEIPFVEKRPETQGERAKRMARQFHHEIRDKEFAKPSELFDLKNDLARLRQNAPGRYEALMEKWAADGFAKGKLSELHVMVKRAQRALQKLMKNRESTDRDGFVRDPSGNIIKSMPENVRNAIEKLDVRLSFDKFAERPLISGLAGYGPALDDHAMRRLRFLINDSFDFWPSKDTHIEVLLDMCDQNRTHPVRELLEWYEITWDCRPRIDRWLIDYCGAPDTPYVRAISRIVMVAAVRRVRQAGCKFDELLVLESPQGLNKSSFLEAMAIRPEWFSDSVPLNADDKRMIESTGGKWIAEISELSGMSKAEVETVKAHLSRTTDRARLAYERLPVEVPRQFILIGTTNAGESAPYLRDTSGNRRFWPVPVQQCDIAAFKRDRELLWGEAAAAESAGESIRLPESLWGEAAIEQSGRSVGNAFADVIGSVLDNKEGIIRASDLWMITGIPLPQRDANAGKLGQAMTSLGWTRKQARFGGGAPVGCYAKGTSGQKWKIEPDTFDRRKFEVRKYDPNTAPEPDEDTEPTDEDFGY